MELLALDTGPGMAHVAQCLQDGYSTAGSPGTGLGAITRLASLWDLYSVPGQGTALLAQVVHRRVALAPGAAPPRCAGPLAVGVVCVPYPGETVCGDAWMVAQQEERCLMLVVDGLGHGPVAAEAAHAVVQACRQHHTRTPEELLAAAHTAARARAVQPLAWPRSIRPRRPCASLGWATSPGSCGRRPGVAVWPRIMGLSDTMRRRQAFTAWSPEAVVVLHSDGLQTRWRLDAYLGLARRQPSLIAGVLYRDFTRGRDDVTVLVVAAPPPFGPGTLPGQE